MDGKKKAAKTNANANETPQQKLMRLAGKRVPKATKAIAALGNLKAYKPTDVQAKAIITAVQTSVDALKERLTAANGKTESTFALPQ